jgi:hypothetical protein
MEEEAKTKIGVNTVPSHGRGAEYRTHSHKAFPVDDSSSHPF